MLLDTIIGMLAPHACVGCGQEGALLCSECGYILSDPAAYSVRGSLDTIRTATSYEGFARDLVWQLKFRGARAAADVMTRHMEPLVPADAGAIVIPVPTATRRVRQRGFDQAKLLARQLSRRTGLRYLDCLRRYGQTHQVGASREQRLTQLAGAFRAKKDVDLRNRRVVLVDDVLTTGATLETAAGVLTNLGANQVDAIVFAQAE